MKQMNDELINLEKKSRHSHSAHSRSSNRASPIAQKNREYLQNGMSIKTNDDPSIVKFDGFITDDDKY